jgi:hypothetical protein
LTAASPGLGEDDLRELDRLIEEALASGDESALRVLGYGEMSLVLGWPQNEPRFACKRLPVFRSRERFDAYQGTVRDYVEALEAAGVEPLATELRPVVRGDGTVAGYAVQPVLPKDTLGPVVLRRERPGSSHPLIERIVATVAKAVGPRLGLDAQLSNWSWQDRHLVYFDLTTPLIWSADGRSRLDLDGFAHAYPWVLRAPLRLFVAPRILDGYRELRSVYLDLCGNLIKEGLDGWLQAFLEQVNRHMEPPLSVDDVRRHYRRDARRWALLLAIRRLDRAWQRRVRRQPYPFLLPKQIER